MNPRTDTLTKAEQLINGDRNNHYGPPNQDFGRTAQLWTTYLDGRTLIEAHDIAAMMILLKISRIRWSPEQHDHWIDIAGYAACGHDAFTSTDQPDDPHFNKWLEYQHTIDQLEETVQRLGEDNDTLRHKLDVLTGKNLRKQKETREK